MEKRGRRVGGEVDALYVCLCACVFRALLMSLWCYSIRLCECVNREIEDGLFCWNPSPTAQASVDHFNLPPTRERGDSLSWNLAHSTGWGNQLRPDWQPPFLILFPRSLLCVLFLLLWSFSTGSTLAAPPPPSSPFLHLPRSPPQLSTDTECTSCTAQLPACTLIPTALCLSVLHDLLLSFLHEFMHIHIPIDVSMHNKDTGTQLPAHMYIKWYTNILTEPFPTLTVFLQGKHIQNDWGPLFIQCYQKQIYCTMSRCCCTVLCLW